MWEETIFVEKNFYNQHCLPFLNHNNHFCSSSQSPSSRFLLSMSSSTSSLHDLLGHSLFLHLIGLCCVIYFIHCSRILLHAIVCKLFSSIQLTSCFSIPILFMLSSLSSIVRSIWQLLLIHSIFTMYTLLFLLFSISSIYCDAFHHCSLNRDYCCHCNTSVPELIDACSTLFLSLHLQSLPLSVYI